MQRFSARRCSVFVVGLLLFGAACAKKVKEPEPVLKPAVVAKPKPSRSLVTQTVQAVQAAPPEPPKIDPALVPVEEDFRKEAESKVDKRTNLEVALERIANELKPPKEASTK
jgi:hypothetical protein